MWKIMALCLLLISAVLEHIEYTHIVQFADYRMDRIKDYFLGRGGIKSISRLHWIWKIALASLFFYKGNFLNNILFIKLIIIFVLVLDILYRIYFIRRNKDKLPTITIRSVFSIFFPTATEAVIFYYLWSINLAYFVLILRPFIFKISFFILWPFFEILKKTYIYIATQKMLKYKNLIVIGITGSYGKTTVKNFLHQILSQKYKIISTPKNVNTEIGIASFILKNDFSKYKIFIAEMGAYGRGEIKIMAKMVKPKFGILTAIIEQHLALFKTIKNIQLAKFELPKSLEEDGIAIINNDNKYCREMLGTVKAKIETYGKEKEFKPFCEIKKAKQIGTKLDISLKIGKDEYEFKANLLGEHQVYNIAPSIIVARHLSFSKNEIIEACKKLETPERTMKLFNFGKSFVIDDSYNANPDGFKEALKTLESFDKKFKRIVFARGMFELGKKSKDKHLEVAEYMNKYADKVVITTKIPGSLFEPGINKEQIDFSYILDKNSLIDEFKNLKNTESIILLEHRLPEEVYNFLLSQLK